MENIQKEGTKPWGMDTLANKVANFGNNKESENTDESTNEETSITTDDLHNSLEGIGNEGTESNPEPTENQEIVEQPNSVVDENPSINTLNLNVDLKDKVIVRLKKGSQPINTKVKLPKNSVIYNGNYWAMHLKMRAGTPNVNADSVVLDMRFKPGGFNTLEFPALDVEFVTGNPYGTE